MVNRTVFIAARRGFWRGARGGRLLITGGIGGKDSDLLPLPDVLYKVPDRFDGWEQFVALLWLQKLQAKARLLRR